MAEPSERLVSRERYEEIRAYVRAVLGSAGGQLLLQEGKPVGRALGMLGETAGFVDGLLCQVRELEFQVARHHTDRCTAVSWDPEEQKAHNRMLETACGLCRRVWARGDITEDGAGVGLGDPKGGRRIGPGAWTLPQTSIHAPEGELDDPPQGKESCRTCRGLGAICGYCGAHLEAPGRCAMQAHPVMPDRACPKCDGAEGDNDG